MTPSRWCSDSQDSPSLLRERLWSHPLEHPHQAYDLVRRLALEQHWSLPHAKAAIEEYRRFCYLACVAGHPVTPSEEVDAVWHLHLLHTRDYWEVFCPQVLGRPLHHGPTLGGVQEEQRFYDQYAHTLASYQTHFGPPPAAFWPTAAIRFQPMRHWRWVYLPHAWVVPKPQSCLAFMKRPWRALVSLFSLSNRRSA